MTTQSTMIFETIKREESKNGLQELISRNRPVVVVRDSCTPPARVCSQSLSFSQRSLPSYPQWPDTAVDLLGSDSV